MAIKALDSATAAFAKKVAVREEEHEVIVIFLQASSNLSLIPHYFFTFEQWHLPGCGEGEGRRVVGWECQR